MERTSTRRKRTGPRFRVLVEFACGIFGIYGIGRLLAWRLREVRILILFSLVWLGISQALPSLTHDQYNLWITWVANLVLAAASAVQFNIALDREERSAKRR